MGTIGDKLDYLKQTKQEIKTAIVNKGVAIEDTDTFRSYAEKIQNIKTGGIDTSQFTNTTKLYYYNRQIETLELDVSNVNNADNMCESATNLKDASALDFKSVKYLQQSFKGCSNLIKPPKITSTELNMLNETFSGCVKLPDFETQIITENVRDMYGAFRDCKTLTKQPITSTANVYSRFDYAFYGCENLQELELDLGRLTSNYDSAFRNCKSLVTCKIKNLKVNVYFRQSTKLAPTSVAYMINNVATTGSITIYLNNEAYNNAISDEEVNNALTEHTNVKLQQV